MRISSVAATLLDYLPDFEGHSVWKLGVKIFHGTASVVDSFPVHVRRSESWNQVVSPVKILRLCMVAVDWSAGCEAISLSMCGVWR